MDFLVPIGAFDGRIFQNSLYSFKVAAVNNRLMHKKEKLFILDEWLLCPLKEAEARDVMELVEARNKVVSTIFCSQYDTSEWYENLYDPTIADAIGCSIQAGGHEVKYIQKYWQRTELQNKRFPFVHYWRVRNENGFYNCSEIQPILPMVDAADRELANALLNDAFTANDIILQEENALADGEEMTNTPGAVVKTKPNAIGKVARLGGLQSGKNSLPMIEWLLSQIQRTNRNYETNQGKASGVKTATELSMMRADVDSQMEIKKADRNGGFVRLYELIDWSVLEFYEDQREIYIGAKKPDEKPVSFTLITDAFDTGRPAITDPITGEMVQEATHYWPMVDATVNAGDGIIRSKAATLQALQNLVGVQVTQDNYKLMSAMVEVLDIPQKQEITQEWQDRFSPAVPPEVIQALGQDPQLLQLVTQAVTAKQMAQGAQGKLSYWQNKYQEARQNGDWQGMQNANNEANKIRNEYGYAAQHATDDINKYRPSGSSGGSWGSGYYNQDYMNNMNNWYSQIQAELEAAQKAAVDQAVGQLESQKYDINQSYDDLYRQLYMDRRRAEKNLPQQLAAMGISGGMTESAALGIQNDYSNALQQGEREKINTLRGIDQAISEARLSGDIGLAQQAAELAMNQLNTYANTIAAMQAQQNWQQQFDTSNSQWQQQFDTANKQWQMQWDRQGVLDQISRDDISYDRKLFAAQYLYETTGDASGLKMLGYTDSQIAALRNSYAQAMAQRSTYSSGGGGGGTGKDVRFDEGNNKYKVAAPGPTANRQNMLTYIASRTAGKRRWTCGRLACGSSSKGRRLFPAVREACKRIIGVALCGNSDD